MIDTDNLLTLAEISMTLAGLSGLIAVFLTRGSMTALDGFRFCMIIGIACTNTLCAFIPLWVMRHVTDVESVWQASARLSMLVAVVFGLVVAKPALRYVILDPPDQPLLFRLLDPLFMGSATVLMTFNATSWPVTSNATFYELFLVLGLFTMASIFVSLVLVRDNPDARSGQPVEREDQ